MLRAFPLFSLTFSVRSFNFSVDPQQGADHGSGVAQALLPVLRAAQPTVTRRSACATCLSFVLIDIPGSFVQFCSADLEVGDSFASAMR